MSIRELIRNGSMFGKYDYIDIEDRKSHEYKGVFISSKYADDVKKFLEKKMAKEKQEKLDRIMKFAGKGSIHKRFEDLTASQMREKKAKEQDLEDTLQCLCAKENNCTLLITNNKKFVDCDIKIMNYERFLK